MIRLHVLSVPHTASTKEYTVCAFTQKVLNFCKMYKDMGMHVIHYGRDDSNVVCDEHVTVTTRALNEKVYGIYDWKNQGLKYNQGDEVFKTFNDNCIKEIKKRKQPHDIILCFFGLAQKPVCDAHSDLLCVEPSIGYPSSFAPYKVYESYAVMHGLQGPDKVANAEYKFYDACIPSGFDLTEFEFNDKKEDYFLMCGRMVWSKGVDIASQVCEKLGVKLVLAGTSFGPMDCNLGDTWPAHVEYVGYADVEKRKKLMAGAKGLFCPTIYNEPFGYVAIEAMLSGTPVITVDWGAFTETVQHGITGFRCRTFEQFLWAARNIDTISPHACREWAEKNYNFHKIGLMYKEYFESIINISKGTGWYTENQERNELEWLTKTPPTQNKTFKEILNHYNRIKNGNVHFLQIGAMDGVKHDGLFPYVMSYNWTGVLVEPLPDMFEKLIENYALKDGLKFENSAIARERVVTMHRVPPEKVGTDGIPDWAEGCSTMVPKIHIEDIVPHMIEQEVRGITIQQLYEKYGNKFDFIQIDTEGYDYEIFFQFLEQGFSADLLKIEIAHITYTKAVWMRWKLKQFGYETFIDEYDLIAFRF